MSGYDLSPLWISLRTSAAATALAFFCGIAAARAMSGWRGRLRGLVDGILILPLVLPPTVVGFFLLLIFGRTSAIGRALEAIGIQVVFSWPATVIAAAVVAFPLMYRTALGAFEQVNPNFLAAARTLGAGRWRTFRGVLVPLAWPGIMAGTVLAFARALGEFGATLMLAGNIPGRTQTMPVAIFFAAEAGDMRRAMLWVALTACLSLASIAALHYWGTAERRIPRPAPAAEPPGIVLAAPVSGVRRAVLEIDIRKRLPGFELAVRLHNRGATLGLLGASGSGKSMTLACIAGLETPDEGRIVLNGRVLFDRKAGISVPPAARRVGVVFQDAALFPHLTVRENIGFSRAGQVHGASGVEHWARLARVDALLDRYPHQLSGGQRQRVALARALTMEPDALLLDEPFSGLDPHLRRQLEEELRAALAGFRGAVVLVTHDRSEAFRMCEELAVLDGGRTVASGPRRDLFARPETLAAARVTGCKNLARMRPAGEGRIAVEEWGCTLCAADAIPPDAVYVGIRSHHVKLLAEGGGENTFSCRVVDVVDSPFEVTVYLAIEGGRLEAEMSAAEWQRLAGARELWVRLEPERLLLLR
ncbi:MAG TPA: molybdate ABC transporter permease subunit [Bryobacteraceae bacterium]|nr:molybdate ABC transporter permease subunit [Bryobacteraceae bacterium]